MRTGMAPRTLRPSYVVRSADQTFQHAQNVVGTMRSDPIESRDMATRESRDSNSRFGDVTEFV